MADLGPLPEPEPEAMPEPEYTELDALAEAMAEPMANSTMTAEELEEMAPLENLLPTLLQIFLTVGLGWAAGSLKMFGPKEARGLGMFVGKFSLPALIFISLASLDLSDIKWSFLLAVLISKSIIFGGVFMLDLLLNKNMSRAALFAIYSTQTNDFGMGLPILNSVFGPGHALVGLLYLVAPISLLILNPIGFVLLEVGKDKEGKAGGGGPLATFLGVLRGLVTNPVVAMTVLGVLGNLVFSSSPPPHLAKFLSALGAAFSALAPFSLGLSMVGKLGGIRGDSIKPILALVSVKSIVTPMVTYILVGQLAVWLDGRADPSLSNFALLLGSFPTALGVASYASEYRVSPDLVSAAIVLGTLASAPMMYAIANILTAISESPEALARSDHSWIDCIISIASIGIMFGLFATTAVWRRSPHLLTASLLLLTLLSSAAGLLHAFFHLPSLAILHLTALHASRLSVPGLAVTILLLTRSSAALSSPMATGLLLLSGPLLSLSTLLLLLTPYTPTHFLAFGPSQDYLSLAVHTTSLLPTLVCLLLLSRAAQPSLTGLQVFRHSTLLLTLATAMFTSISLSLGRILLAGSSYPGAFRVLICMNSILSSGQGLLFLAVFAPGQTSRLLAPLGHLADRALAAWGARGAAGDTFVLVGQEEPGVLHKPGEQEDWEKKERKVSAADIGRSV